MMSIVVSMRAKVINLSEHTLLCACACVCARCVSKIAQNASVYWAFGRLRLEIGRQFY